MVQMYLRFGHVHCLCSMLIVVCTFNCDGWLDIGHNISHYRSLLELRETCLWYIKLTCLL